MQQRPGVAKPDYKTPAQKFAKGWNRLDKIEDITAVTNKPGGSQLGGRRRSKARS